MVIYLYLSVECHFSACHLFLLFGKAMFLARLRGEPMQSRGVRRRRHPLAAHVS
jgi:hypothetical protein